MKFYPAQMGSLKCLPIAVGFIHNRCLMCYFDEGNLINPISEFIENIFLDSGAYISSTMGATVNIDKYIRYIKTHEKKIEIYSNLDDMSDPEKTLHNQKYMEEAGLNPLPVYHYGEPMAYLDMYLKSYDYVGIGGMANISSAKKKRFLDVIFNVYPDKKFHGFGVAEIDLINKYSFYSIDNTTWFLGQKFGRLIFEEGQISHYNDMSRKQKDRIADIGISVERIRTDYGLRNVYNLMAIRSLMNNIEHKKMNKNEYNNILEELS